MWVKFFTRIKLSFSISADYRYWKRLSADTETDTDTGFSFSAKPKFRPIPILSAESRYRMCFSRTLLWAVSLVWSSITFLGNLLIARSLFPNHFFPYLKKRFSIFWNCNRYAFFTFILQCYISNMALENNLFFSKKKFQKNICFYNFP